MDFRGTLNEAQHPAFDSLVGDMVEQGEVSSTSLQKDWATATTHQATEVVAELMEDYCRYPDDANAEFALQEIRQDLSL